MIDVVRDETAIRSPDRRLSDPEERRSSGGLNSRSVAILLYDGVALFELGVACDVFGPNDLKGDVDWYQLSICGTVAGAGVLVDAGFGVSAPHGLEAIRRAGTVVVPPTDRLEQVPVEVFDALRQAHERGSRIVCTGAFVLAEAGLLAGRHATTHWSECDDLAARFPDVSVDPGVLYVDDGDILTSAGSAASIDLCLHVVRQDYGAEIATRLARDLVVPPQRDGGQAQFIDAPMPNLEHSDLFAETVAWVQAHLNEPLTVSDLAARSAMSPRTFARRFGEATGTTPHHWLQGQRVHLAQRLLETSDLSIEAVAEASGFCTAGNLRKHFGRVMHTNPQAYRRTFQDRPGG